ERRSMQHLVWSETPVSGGRLLEAKLPQPDLVADEGWGKTGRLLSFYRDVAVLAAPNVRQVIALENVLDISAQMAADGTLRWNAPEGDWSVYRVGHASTGRPPHPVPDDMLGKTLEANKMSEAQTRHHWENVIRPTEAALGELYGASFRHFLIDSYEAGDQNWTEDLREEFLKRKGYDPLRWVLTLAPPIENADAKASRIIGSKDQVARFQWDFRDVVQQLYEERGWRPAAEMINASGVQLQFEPYGGPFDSAAAAAIADIPMVEFWTGSRTAADPTIVGAGRGADRRVIAAEAFTGRPERSHWTETPAELKIDGDVMLASGVNRLVLHHWVHQPFDERYRPGMTMGWWGTHFGRNQTWYEPGKAFIEYLWRVQSLLQYGRTPVDVLSVGSSSEGSDVVPWSQFLAGSLTVEDGVVITPRARRYRLLHVPHDGRLLPEATAEIGRLLRLGATVCAAQPLGSPSLQNYPQCNEVVRRLAEETWGPPDAAPRVVGLGRLYGDGDLSNAMRSTGLTARLVASSPALRHACREGDDETVFFVVNPSPERVEATLLAANERRRPELWDPEGKHMQGATVYRSITEGIETAISLGPGGSVFLVFRESDPQEGPWICREQGPSDLVLRRDAAGGYVALSATGGEVRCEWTTGENSTHRIDPQPAVAIEGPWAVELTPAVGSGRARRMDALSSLSESADPLTKYFSGKATYETELIVDRETLERCSRVDIDLGRVGDLAEVWVNDGTTG
ncbi:MAG: glycosyl hydrolase, partial [Lacipirellulaceae bacterium]